VDGTGVNRDNGEILSVTSVFPEDHRWRADGFSDRRGRGEAANVQAANSILTRTDKFILVDFDVAELTKLLLVWLQFRIVRWLHQRQFQKDSELYLVVDDFTPTKLSSSVARIRVMNELSRFAYDGTSRA
jgi:hypothetical protein